MTIKKLSHVSSVFAPAVQSQGVQFQLFSSRRSCTARQCCSWLKQPVVSTGGGLYYLTVLPICCKLNRSRKNRITVEHGQKVKTGCIFLQMLFQGVLGVATPGVMLLSVIGPLDLRLRLHSDSQK